MTVTCPECRSVFRVDPAKVPATGVRARCSVCGGVIAIAATAAAPPSGRSAASGAATPTGAPAPAAALQAPGQPTPRSLSALATPVARATPLPGAVPSGGGSSPMMASPLAPSTAPSAVPSKAPAAATPAGAAAQPMATPASSGTGVLTPRRSINPFLNADPGQRARRLARALVSDLVAYHPHKREEGLRNSTLRQLFRDEIKKSYEEYVEQVGRDLAESTSHFQEALNDILADGRKLF
jgi:predicted Zn finger-like uncharacterized protein